jgi:hypothetical protein
VQSIIAVGAWLSPDRQNQEAELSCLPSTRTPGAQVPTIDAGGQAREVVQAKDQGRCGHTCRRATMLSSNLDSGPLPGGRRSSAAHRTQIRPHRAQHRRSLVGRRCRRSGAARKATEGERVPYGGGGERPKKRFGGA